MVTVGHFALVDLFFFFYSFSSTYSKRLRAAISKHMTSALTTALNMLLSFQCFSILSVFHLNPHSLNTLHDDFPHSKWGR